MVASWGMRWGKRLLVRWEDAVAALWTTSTLWLIFTREYRVSQGFFSVFLKECRVRKVCGSGRLGLELEV
jgi:hypothetical protein